MIPPAMARSLTLPRLEAGAFVATMWHSAEDKAKFGSHLLRFIADGFPKATFTKSFYLLLSLHAGSQAGRQNGRQPRFASRHSTVRLSRVTRVEAKLAPSNSA